MSSVSDGLVDVVEGLQPRAQPADLAGRREDLRLERVWVLEVDEQEPCRLVRRRRIEPEGGTAQDVLARPEVQVDVAAGDLARLVDAHDVAALERRRAVAEPPTEDMSWVTRGWSGPRPQPVELAAALLLEGGVADSEHLVEEEDLGVDLDHHREREPHDHPRRVVLEREFSYSCELGELEVAVAALARLGRRQAEDDRLQEDVVAAASSGLKPTPSSIMGEMRPLAPSSQGGVIDAGEQWSSVLFPRRCGRRCRRTRPARRERDVEERRKLVVPVRPAGTGAGRAP